MVEVRSHRTWVGLAVAVLLGGGLIGLWHLLIVTEHLPAYLFGSPKGVMKEFHWYLTSGYAWKDLSVTYLEVIVGLLIGTAVGLLLGVFGTIVPSLEQGILLLAAIPKPLIAAFTVLFLGIGMVSKIGLAAFISFSVVFFNVSAGLRSIPRGYRALFRIYRASTWTYLQKLALPYAVLWLLASLKQAMLLAFAGAFMGEFLASSVGLGYRLQYYVSGYHMDGVWVVSVFIVLPLQVALLGVRQGEAVLERLSGLATGGLARRGEG